MSELHCAPFCEWCRLFAVCAEDLNVYWYINNTAGFPEGAD